MDASLTDTQLEELIERSYRAAVDAFDAASKIYADMAQMATWTPVHAELDARAGRLMNTGRQQSQVAREAADLQSSRLAAVTAAAILAQSTETADRA